MFLQRLFYFILLYFITHVRTSSGSRSRGCNAFDEAGVAYIVEVTRAHGRFLARAVGACLLNEVDTDWRQQTVGG